MAELKGINKYREELIQTANAIAAPGKGILAADESTGTIGKRFDKIKVENNEANRRAYRELLFTSKGLGQYCSGAILYEETLYQKAEDGTLFVDLMKKEGIIPGIKVDKGLVNIPGTNDETATWGLDGMAERAAKYYAAGARFAKWRSALKITDKEPSELAILENAHGLARYATICQENGLVPIIEPEIMMDGTHSLARCQEVTEHVLSVVFRVCSEYHVFLEGALLKPNMVTPGHESSEYKTTSPDAIGKATVTALARTVPPALPGVTFLSGGQSEEEASVNLNAINAYNGHKKPWSLTFSYGRALQGSCLDAWKGQKDNVLAAQNALLTRAKANSLAQQGQYKGTGATGGDLYEANYKY